MNKLARYIVVLPLIGAMLVPGISSAQTVSQLQAEIQSLLAQLNTLQQELAAAQGSGPWCHTFSTNLKIGNGGVEVTALQTALQKSGMQISVNGSFDDQTASAVTGFQEKYTSDILTPNGLQYGTGYVGAATRAKLNSLYGCGTATTNSTSSLSIAVYATPSSLVAPDPVSFLVTCSLARCGTGYNSSWNFGDGSPSVLITNNPNASHTFTSAGSYLPSVTVTDNTGNTAQGSVAVNVGVAPTTTNCATTAAGCPNISIDDSANGTTVNLTTGQTIGLTLRSTYWQINDSSNSSVLALTGSSVAPAYCLPAGSGCGTQSATFTAKSSGTVTITASRTTCGEALACQPNQETYSVTVVVH
jgi:hypothetical protein